MANKYLNPPSNQRFYNIMAFTLTIIAMNTGFWKFHTMPKSYAYSVLRYFSYTMCPIAVLSQIIYLFVYHSELDFNTLSIIYTAIPVCLVLLVKQIITQMPAYKKAMIEFLEEIHIFTYYRDHEGPFVEKILIRTEKYTRWSIYVFGTLCFVCSTTFLFVPIIHNIQNNPSIFNITSRLEIMVHLWLPIDYEYNFFYWIIMQVVVTGCVVVGISIIVVFDVINVTFLYHLIGHIEIFKNILKNDFKEKMTQENVNWKLIEVSRYYQFIRRIFKDVENAFGLNIIGIYMHNLLGGGLFIYQITSAGADTETLLSYGLMIPIYMGELIIMSLVMEEIRIQSNDIPELVYNLRWEEMNLSNQKLVQMVLFQVQPVLEFRAAFSVQTGIQPAVNIIKTTFSYYVIIKSRV